MYTDLKEFLIWLHDEGYLIDNFPTEGDCSCPLYEFVEDVVLDYLGL